MRVDSRAHLAASLVALATRSRHQELSLGGPLPLVLPAVVLPNRVGRVVSVGLGGVRAVGKVTPIMGTASKHCHQLSHTEVRINFRVINIHIYCQLSTYVFIFKVTGEFCNTFRVHSLQIYSFVASYSLSGKRLKIPFVCVKLWCKIL
jgi:hypothetical protein